MNLAFLERCALSFGVNPCVTIHELRTRMRGLRPFLVMLTYTLVAAIAIAVTVGIMLAQDSTRYAYYEYLSWGTQSAEMGRMSFIVLSYTQLVLIALMVPAFSAGTIALEREKQTLEMLKVSLLTAFDIVTGKLLVVLAFAGLLLVTSLPFAAWSVLLGGVQPTEILFIYTYLFAVAAMIGSGGLFMSALIQRTLGAVVASYAALLAAMVGAPLLFILIQEVSGNYMGSGSGLDLTFALTALLVIAAVLGLLVMTAVRWLEERLGRWGRGKVGCYVALSLGGLACVLAVSLLAGPIFNLTTVMDAQAPLVIHPAVTPLAILIAEVGDEIVGSGASAGGTGAPATPVDPQPYIWAISTALALLAALALWALAVRTYRARV